LNRNIDLIIGTERDTRRRRRKARKRRIEENIGGVVKDKNNDVLVFTSLVIRSDATEARPHSIMCYL